MLTGEVLPDDGGNDHVAHGYEGHSSGSSGGSTAMCRYGDAYVCGHSVTSDLAAARSSLGYCPQFDSLLGAMTASEVLHLYAALRGLPRGPATSALVAGLLGSLGLAGPPAQRPCATLSGGNKRKLALGVALVSHVWNKETDDDWDISGHVFWHINRTYN
jgi:energy-coupling factor transporter ATP-binding protein EcfA2